MELHPKAAEAVALAASYWMKVGPDLLIAAEIGLREMYSDYHHLTGGDPHGATRDIRFIETAIKNAESQK